MTAVAAAGWLARAREAAWKAFREAPPPPAHSETWRRLPLSAWDLGRVGEGDAPVLDPLTPEARAAAQGAELLSLEEAAAAYPDLLKKALSEPSAPPDYRALETANLALWRGGAFLRVPRGVRLAEPVHLVFRHDASRPFSFPRVVVAVEEGASATVVESHVGAGTGEGSVSAAFSRATVGRGGSLSYFQVQELPPGAVHFHSQRAELAEEARLDHYAFLLGARRHKSALDVVVGRGAKSELKGLALGRGGQIFDVHTRQDHAAPGGRSDLLFKTALKDKARAIYTGYIRVEREAPGCEAYQTNNNLLLSETARADSTPVLEILPDAVSCKHGATAGPVDPDVLHYMATRGVPEAEAVPMLVLGFFEPILADLPLEALRERLSADAAREAGA